ncbi:MAG: class I SAM-dependent methyltransferase [Propionibacteriaceae bacterium]
MLDRTELRGDEQALDLGCGRGAVTVSVALRLPRGRVTGIDLWRSIDQSGNNEQATRANLELNKVADRVRLTTGDMTALPFDDRTFDLVKASLAIHNVPSAAGREVAVREAVRVLKPGGTMLIVDVFKTREYVRTLRTMGIIPVRNASAGWRMWWTGPWMPTRLITVTMP